MIDPARLAWSRAIPTRRGWATFAEGELLRCPGAMELSRGLRVTCGAPLRGVRALTPLLVYVDRRQSYRDTDPSVGLECYECSAHLIVSRHAAPSAQVPA